MKNILINSQKIFFRLVSFASIFPRIRWLTLRKKCPILIVDQTGAEQVSKVIPQNQAHWTLPVRNEIRFINFQILFHFFHDLDLVLLRKINMLGLYVMSVAKFLDAKVLVTLIDNCNWDKNLSQVSNLRIICIQNGIRSETTLQKKSYDLFLAIGKRDAQIVQDRSNLALPVGSLNLALAKQAQLKLSRKNIQSLDIFFISQYRREFWNSERIEDIRHVQAVKKTLRWISKLSQENHLRVGIGFSAKGSDRSDLFLEEKKIYDSYLNYPYEVFKREGFRQRGKDCSYGGLFRSHVIVTFSSSMTLEAIGMEKNVVMTTLLLGNIDSEHYEWFPKNEFGKFFVEPSYDAFRRKILNFLDGDNKNHKKSTLAPYYCVPPNSPDTLKVIEHLIEQAIDPNFNR